MLDDIKPVHYHPGIFDKYKENGNLDFWEDFPNLMWGLGYEMETGESFAEYSEVWIET